MFDFEWFRIKFIEYRKDNKLSQEDFAELLNVSFSTVQRIEQSVNIPSTEVIVNFLNLLKTNVNTFVGGSDLKELYFYQLYQLISQLNQSEIVLFTEILATIEVFADGD